MAETKTTTSTTTKSTNQDYNEVIIKAQGFWAKYSKPIIYVGSAVILLIAAWYAYQNFIKIPNEKNASEAIFPAEAIFDKMASTEFNKDSVNIALNGGNLEGNNITGLLKIINKYGGTMSGNRAKYMVGATYLQIKEFDKAIKYLKDFDGNGADQVQNKAYLMIGHAYAEKKNTDEALDYYKKAASVNEKDEGMSADALIIAASYADAMGKKNDAIDLYKKLKDKYPSSSSVSNGEVDKQLARLGVLNTD